MGHILLPESKIASQELRQGTFLSSFSLVFTLAPSPDRRVVKTGFASLHPLGQTVQYSDSHCTRYYRS